MLNQQGSGLSDTRELDRNRLKWKSTFWRVRRGNLPLTPWMLTSSLYSPLRWLATPSLEKVTSLPHQKKNYQYWHGSYPTKYLGSISWLYKKAHQSVSPTPVQRASNQLFISWHLNENRQPKISRYKRKFSNMKGRFKNQKQLEWEKNKPWRKERQCKRKNLLLTVITSVKQQDEIKRE